MISDSITNASPTSAPQTRDFGKKKRANRSAKLKQCKLDARREQWLSQATAKNKRCEEETKDNHKSEREKLNEDRSFVNLDTEHTEEDKEGAFVHGSHIDLPPNSPSGSSTLGGTASSLTFSGSSSRSSTSSASGGFCSGDITEEEDGDGDDGCLEDWEAFADALAANEKQEHQNQPPELEPTVQSATLVVLHDGAGTKSGSGLGVNNPNQNCERILVRAQLKNRAWRPDDKLRPQILPNLSKQRSFPATARHFRSTAVESSCPICCEDLDLTDSNFLPCPCGFQLCLFCHKKICDGDGRCPGCRKPYDQNAIKTETSVHEGGLIIRLARSCSMVYRT